MITSHQNPLLKDIRRLQRRRDGRFVAEGEDLLAAADAAGWASVARLRAGVDVDPEVLAKVSSLGSGSRELGIFEERWAAAPVGPLCVYLHGLGDPGNVGAVLRSAHAFGAGSVVLGPGCADPFGPKAVRASMGAIFTVPVVRGGVEGLPGEKVALVAGEGEPLAAVAAQVADRPGGVLCDEGLALSLLVGAERAGLPPEVVAVCDRIARIPIRGDSLNAAMATTVGLYELAGRLAA
ncbi:MAG: RNA methyltransferase [Solirubrobacteraceae bacterium MAG38_C4-C5]|nr:RNA methyltransferase [Candidatus Siliceabacter maunaloa]